MAKSKHRVLNYIQGLHAARATGKATAEQSYKSKLEALLTAVGGGFDPELHATMELMQEGAGQPDLGIFEVRSKNLRLVVEAKPVKDIIYDTAKGEQVSKYWNRYGFVLVSNFREFLLVGRDAKTQKPVVEARYRISASADAFWKTTPSKLAEEHEQGLVDFLEGVFARPAPILKPKDLATDLARHAREAKRRLGKHSIEDLQSLQDAFERTLGLTFTDEQGIRFFRSSLVQTLFYGLFSGWMLWRAALPKGSKPPLFDWREASQYLDLPLIAELFDEVAKPTRLKNLDLREPVEWAAASLNRVSHKEFFATFDADHAITLFYEPFLEAFDPVLREELGVWYTPPEIVHYMVERVDQLLRDQLDIKDGLADERVYVLDPAVGTGSFLLDVGRRIYKTLAEQGHGALAAAKVKKAMCERVFGFEILTAPYVVSHLQLGVLLRELGAKLASDERVGVFLTNALTGWEPPKGVKQVLAFAFLQEEQDRAAKVKRESRILVVLGNPPYRGNKGVAQKEEADLVQTYKEGLNEKYGIRKQTLDDPYIRFFRLAERRIGEISKRGIICYISNYGWLNGIPHVIMRERLLHGFDTIFIDNLHGNRKAKERAPDGAASETVFAIRGSSPGIKIGTAIATLVKSGDASADSNSTGIASVEFRDFDDASAEARRARLLRSLEDREEGRPRESVPSAEARWSLLPSRRSAAWASWPTLPELLGESFKGVQPGRGRALISIDREPLERQMRAYFDKSNSDAELLDSFADLMTNESGYNATAVRYSALSGRLKYDPAKIRPIAWQPFDTRWYFDEDRIKLVHRRRPEYAEQVWKGNLFLAATQKPRFDKFPIPVVIEHVGSYYFFDPYATYFPMRRHVIEETLMGGPLIRPGVDETWLERVCKAYEVPAHPKDPQVWTEAALKVNDLLFFHTVAALSAPAYADSNIEAIRIDWPRVPVPKNFTTLKASAAHGRMLADLLMPERAVDGVTTGKILGALRSLAVPFKEGGGQIDPDEDLIVDGWASIDSVGRVSAQEGKVTPNKERPDDAVDVWINERVGWRNIPKAIWGFTLGGYPVVNKWLSYREHRVINRPITDAELIYVSEIVRRLATVMQMADKLNANYAACAKGFLSAR